MIWVDPPHPGNKVLVALLYADATANVSSILRPGDLPIAPPLDTPDGSVFLVRRETPLEAVERAVFESIAAKLHINYEAGSTAEGFAGATVVMVTTDGNGLPVVEDVSLGLGNIRIASV